MALKVNYKDDVLNTTTNDKRKFNLIQNDDGTVSLVDATDYSQVGDSFGAADINATNEFVNGLTDSLPYIGNDTIHTMSSDGDWYATDNCIAIVNIAGDNGSSPNFTVNDKRVIANAGNSAIISSFAIKKGQKVSLLLRGGACSVTFVSLL